MRSILYTLFISALATVASAFPTHSGTCLSDGPTIQGVTGSPMGKLVTTLGYNFQVTMKNNNYVPGGPAVKFSVTGKTAFMGLLLYAVDSQKNHVGTWNTPKGYQYLGNLAGSPCKGDNGSSTLTHTDSTLKGPSVDFEWTPPSSDIGPINFVGTLVQSGTAGFQIVKGSTNFTVAGSKVTGPPSSGGDNSTTSGGSSSSPTSTSDSPYGSGSNGTTATGASATNTHSDASSLTKSALLLQLTAVISLFLYYL